METQLQTKVLNLPILQRFDQSEIATQGKNALAKFRKGELPIYRILQLGFIGVLGYLSWVYVLPPVFMALGQLFAVAATAVGIIFLILLAPAIFKGLRMLTRGIHKGLIKYDPFGELEEQKQKMIDNQRKFRLATSKIKTLKDDMQNQSVLSEKKAKELAEDIVSEKVKVDRLRSEIDEMKKKGKDAMASDEFAQKNSDLMKAAAETQRQGHVLQQTQDFVRKYGVRAQVMQKLGQKLLLVDTVTDIKIKDFQATIDILKKDSEFAARTREATETAKSAMGFAQGWELDYALDVVTSTIANDIATTTVNLNDINTLTADFDMDNDEIFAKLDKLTNDIKTGVNVTPEAKQYMNPDYQMTADDKLSSGGFGSMF